MQTKIEITPEEKNQEIKDLISGMVVINKDVIHKSIYMLFGIQNWFKAYMVSEDFKKLSPDSQKESFETYCELRDMLSYIEDKAQGYDESIGDKLF